MKFRQNKETFIENKINKSGLTRGIFVKKKNSPILKKFHVKMYWYLKKLRRLN
jgi:hypothetical protein